MAGFGYGSWLAPMVALGGAGAAALLYVVLRLRADGNEAMARGARAVRVSVQVFLRECGRLLGPAAVVLLGLIAWLLGPAAAFSFALGALLSALSAVVGGEGASLAGVRAAQAAREAGGPRARNTAYAGGVVSGLAVASLALLGVGVARLVLSSSADLPAFALGASCVALVTRSGGLLSKAAARGVGFLSRLGEFRKDDRSPDPAQTLTLAGEIAADTAGAGADLFDSLAGALVSAAAVGAAGWALPGEARPALSVFPLLLAAAGLLACAACGLALAAAPGLSGTRTVRLLSTLPPLALVVSSFVLSTLLDLSASVAAAAAFGAVVSPALGAATRHYASRKPVSRLAESSQLGPAANVLAGLAAGLEGAVLPALLLGVALFAAASAAGLYGAALCAVGMASCAGLSGSLSAFAPVASQARGIAASSGLGGDVREMTESLHAEGVAQSAQGRGFAAGAAALSAIALFCAYIVVSGLSAIDLGHPKALVGLLLGAPLPFLISAMALHAVGDVAFEMVAQARRILRGAEEGSGGWIPQWATEASRVAVGRTVAPSLTALGVPVVVGLGLGAEALGATLAGAIASGTLLSFVLADAGDVWRGGRRWIEAGALGGEGSEAHGAALVGDAVGEPLKDAAGPAVQVLMKAMAAVSLVLAPLLPHV